MSRAKPQWRLVGALLAFLSMAPLASNNDPIGPMAPTFELPVIANGSGRYSLETPLERVTYLDYWASWCGPCRVSLPALNSIYDELRDQGLDIIAISVDVVEEDALDFLKKYPVNYPVLLDSRGDIAKAFGVSGMPSGYLIDQNGIIRDVHIGFRRGDELKIRQSIMELLQNRH